MFYSKPKPSPRLKTLSLPCVHMTSLGRGLNPGRTSYSEHIPGSDLTELAFYKKQSTLPSSAPDITVVPG